MAVSILAVLFCICSLPCSAESRWVSLSPSLTELICDLGFRSHLVGRSSACDFPADVRTVPIVGDFGRPNWELLLRMHPDCVFATDLERPSMLKALKSVNIKVEWLPCEGWEGLLTAARRISEVAGDPDRGEAWCAAMNERRRSLDFRFRRPGDDQPRLRVYIEIWHHPLTTAGAKSFLHDLITLSGGENIADVFPERYPHVSSEWVVRQNPDAIVLTYMLPIEDAAAALIRRPGWEGINAVRNGAVCADIPPDLLLRPGPRCLEGAEKLAEWLAQQQARYKETEPRATKTR